MKAYKTANVAKQQASARTNKTGVPHVVWEFEGDFYVGTCEEIIKAKGDAVNDISLAEQAIPEGVGLVRYVFNKARDAGMDRYNDSPKTLKRLAKAGTKGNKAYLLVFTSQGNKFAALSFNRPKVGRYEAHSVIIAPEWINVGAWAVTVDKVTPCALKRGGW